MSFKSSRGKNVGKELEVWQSSIVGQGVGGGGAAVPVSATTGGDVDGLEPGNGYVYHTFTSPGAFVLSGDPINADIIVTAGGGGGGSGPSYDSTNAGGGGGGVAYIVGVEIQPGTYPVTVGGGGAAWPSLGGPPPKAGGNGEDSLFGPGTPLPITAKGGGGGGGNDSPRVGRNGGSGGGGGDPTSAGGRQIQQSENGPLIPLGLINMGSPGVPRHGGGASGPAQPPAPLCQFLNNNYSGPLIGVPGSTAKFGTGGVGADGPSGGGWGGGGRGFIYGGSGSAGIVIVRYIKGYSN